MPKAAPVRRSTRVKSRETPGYSRNETRRKPSKKPSKKTPKEDTVTPFVRTQQDSSNDPNRRIRPFNLPRELTQHISSFLSLAERICFTLTCKEAAETVGSDIWATFKGVKRLYYNHQLIADRDELCQLLSKDLGALVFHCKNCGVMHPTQMLPPRLRRTAKWTTFCLGHNAEIDYLPSNGSTGYVLTFEHILRAMKESEGRIDHEKQGPIIELLGGDLTVEKPEQNLTWRMNSSGRYIGGKLIFKHVHFFQNLERQPLRPKQVLDLPVRLCPHQSTTTALPVKSRSINSHNANGSLLTHAITSVFPEASRKGVDMSVFRAPTKTELEQMSAAKTGGGYIYKCRSCPTKYRVEFAAGELRIIAWQCFGKDPAQASKYWKWFVRREGYSLGIDKRNDEWWSHGRSIPDFLVNED
ncbi:unnamed protein product [Periconia digitata]|uniref:F-box domain-containing protein n=1 Tax=Periconia digitata TaxID=1303443 RepID=A0A9W4UNB9_9PLEO|nr:unnamed protein product [Periconia digitata]